MVGGLSIALPCRPALFLTVLNWDAPHGFQGQQRGPFWISSILNPFRLQLRCRCLSSHLYQQWRQSDSPLQADVWLQPLGKKKNSSSQNALHPDPLWTTKHNSVGRRAMTSLLPAWLLAEVVGEAAVVPERVKRLEGRRVPEGGREGRARATTPWLPLNFLNWVFPHCFQGQQRGIRVRWVWTGRKQALASLLVFTNTQSYDYCFAFLQFQANLTPSIKALFENYPSNLWVGRQLPCDHQNT